MSDGGASSVICTALPEPSPAAGGAAAEPSSLAGATGVAGAFFLASFFGAASAMLLETTTTLRTQTNRRSDMARTIQQRRDRMPQMWPIQRGRGGGGACFLSGRGRVRAAAAAPIIATNARRVGFSEMTLGFGVLVFMAHTPGHRSPARAPAGPASGCTGLPTIPPT